MFPCQIVIALGSVNWTRITEEYYLSPESDGDLFEWYEGLQGNLYYN